MIAIEHSPTYGTPIYSLTDCFCFGICNTQWEVLLSKQVNYNQVVIKCQILQEILNAKFFKIWNIQIQGLFKDFQGPTLFSSTFKGLEFFPQIQGLLKDPMNPERGTGIVCFSFFFGLRVLDKAEYSAFESTLNSSIVSYHIKRWVFDYLCIWAWVSAQIPRVTQYPGSRHSRLCTSRLSARSCKPESTVCRLTLKTVQCTRTCSA